MWLVFFGLVKPNLTFTNTLFSISCVLHFFVLTATVRGGLTNALFLKLNYKWIECSKRFTYLDIP